MRGLRRGATAQDDTLSRRAVIARIGGTAGAAAIVASTAPGLGSSRAGAAPVAVERLTAHQISFTPLAQAEPGGHVQAVVSAHELATQAGVDVLAAGGSAADAAIAVAAALSVVEPFFSSVLGGGTWALYYDAVAGEVTNLDGVGPVGRAATIEDYQTRVDQPGIHQAILPGAWDGWMLWLDRYGRLDLGEVLAPAIRLAREGYPVSAEMSVWLNQEANSILASPSTAAIYAPDGALPGEGVTITQTAMADTFEALVAAYDSAAGGDRSAAVQAARDYFYRGPLAEAIVAVSDEGGGYLTLEDFAAFEAEIVEPVSIPYGDDIRVYQNAPNSQGITMLLALNILKGYNLSDLDPDGVDAVHLEVEAVKLAFADRFQWVGDPDRTEVPVESLLSDAHASLQRQRIDPSVALEWPIRSRLREYLPAHTTTFHVVDRDGNAAAVTTSLGGQFLAVGDTGIHINERMQFLSLEIDNVNQLEPGYKVRHTSCPYLALRGDRPYILGG
nr:gamma-glutamyltransferase [Chloroflexia bacterium]